MGELEGAVIVSCLESIESVDGLGGWVVDPLIVDIVLAVIRLCEPADHLFWVKTAIEAKLAHLVLSSTNDLAFRFQLDIYLGEFHGIVLPELAVKALPFQRHTLILIIRIKNKDSTIK